MGSVLAEGEMAVVGSPLPGTSSYYCLVCRFFELSVPHSICRTCKMGMLIEWLQEAEMGGRRPCLEDKPTTVRIN